MLVEVSPRAPAATERTENRVRDPVADNRPEEDAAVGSCLKQHQTMVSSFPSSSPFLSSFLLPLITSFLFLPSPLLFSALSVYLTPG